MEIYLSKSRFNTLHWHSYASCMSRGAPGIEVLSIALSEQPSIEYSGWSIIPKTTPRIPRSYPLKSLGMPFRLKCSNWWMKPLPRKVYLHKSFSAAFAFNYLVSFLLGKLPVCKIISNITIILHFYHFSSHIYIKFIAFFDILYLYSISKFLINNIS